MTNQDLLERAKTLGVDDSQIQELLEKAIGKREKTVAKEQESKESEALKACHGDLIKAISECLANYGIVLGSKQIIAKSGVNGQVEVDIKFASKAKANGGGNSNRSAPKRHGKATYQGKEHNSPSALAKSLGLKVPGHKDMTNVFVKNGYAVEIGEGDTYHISKPKTRKPKADPKE